MIMWLRPDKLDGNSRMRQDGWKIVSCVIPYDFCHMELDERRSDSYGVISSLLEKYNSIRAHCFKNKKSMGLLTINYNLNQGRRNGFVIGGAKKNFLNYTFISNGYDFVHYLICYLQYPLN